ncbi:MAG: cytochrome c3 family protein [Pyrinomonadaceae bacterium]|nr:cytochrome c3 family protein [Pyrinomonadaceae bacterium]
MKRKLMILVTVLFTVAGAAMLSLDLPIIRSSAQTQTQDVQKMPEVIILAKDSRLGQVTFNHVSHNSGKYTIDGTTKIACTECHHTAQPAADLADMPPLKTAWPADRTTVLTDELFKKDPKAAGVAACRDCHARAGATPKLLPAIPEIKHEASTAIIRLVNQQAFHRSCDGCHIEVRQQNPQSKAPSATSCVTCHKRTA